MFLGSKYLTSRGGPGCLGYTKVKVDGTGPMYWFIFSPYTIPYLLGSNIAPCILIPSGFCDEHHFHHAIKKLIDRKATPILWRGKITMIRPCASRDGRDRFCCISWNPKNDHCFDWSLGLVLEGWVPSKIGRSVGF